MTENLRVLYVEDDMDIAEEIIYFLKKRVRELFVAKNGQEGYELYRKKAPDIILTDVQMPVMNGLDMSAKIREEDTDIPIIIISAYNDTNFLTRSIDLGINSYLTKPVNLSKMLQSIHKAYELQSLRIELKKRNKELEDINENLDAIVEQKTKKLQFLYHHDALTHLQNSIALQKALQKEEFSFVVLLDIANFSYINKQYGKVFGNKILVAVAELLRAHCNSNIDLYKVESDRFVFLLKESTKENAEEFCEQIQSFFDTKKVEVENVPLGVSFNIGIASASSQKEVMIHAEYALDIAKKLGARYYAFYNEQDEVVQQGKQMIAWLNITKEMIETDMIIPYFQPILDAKSNKIIKFEVLARGVYKKDIIEPYYFIEPATRLGLISSITRMIIQKSFQFFSHNSYSFSLNISERDLHEEYLYEYLKERSKDFGIDASRVTLEILESVTTGLNHQQITHQINKIKSLGYKIAIDDFGTENANFSRLMHMNFDYIKLDGTFMKDIQKSQRQQLIVKSIVELAKVLGIETIAEFIENEEVCHIARECGVDMLQGYYFGRPSQELVDNIIWQSYR